jgi:single-stranded-DNA-specific exonuclease
VASHLEQAGIPPLLARLYAARGVLSADEIDGSMQRLLPPNTLRGSAEAAVLLADLLDAHRRVCVVADYDCDGATACAVALRGLHLLGFSKEQLCYVVPDRAVHGYGLTPAIVDLARQQSPDLILTVDNGIASLEGIAHAKAAGLRTLITDHHLCAVDAQGQLLIPEADVIVNPNHPECSFESKSIAGVGVMFYVLLALRAELRKRGKFETAPEPRLDTLLDLVALGTVADVVKLDINNRRLVAQGLKRIRQGRMHAGIEALMQVAKRAPQRASTMDFGFSLGPRLNAAGRLADMTLGIECLLTDDPTIALDLANRLDQINRERRDVESQMKEQAEALLRDDRFDFVKNPEAADNTPCAIALFDPSFHEGVVGILAGRLKERFHRPTFVFARGQDGLLKGSGRSIPGFHLRDALDLVSKRYPHILKKFGGHAMAAGATIDELHFDLFQQVFSKIARDLIAPADLNKHLLTDGPLEPEHFTPQLIDMLEQQVWGQAFEHPTFADHVEIVSQRIVGEGHLKLTLRLGGAVREAIWFGQGTLLPETQKHHLAYRVSINTYQGRQSVQMMVVDRVEAGG